MTRASPPDGGNEAFEVSLDPAPKADIVDADEDEEEAAKRAAALASTFDPAIAHTGKTDEELIAERAAEGRLLLDAAIALGVVVAIAEAEEAGVTEGTLGEADGKSGEPETEAPPLTDMQDGE